MDQDFPFGIRDVADLLRLHVRRKNAVSLDVECPFCGEKKGKLNLNLPKNVFKCNRCGETGGMLALYGKIYGVDTKTAYEEINTALGLDKTAPDYEVKVKQIKKEEPKLDTLKKAPDDILHKTYTKLLGLLTLSDVHRQGLLKRGFTPEQIEENGYKSTPVFGFKGIVKKLQADHCVIGGIPGFYEDKDGEWSLAFTAKSSGFLVPVRNIDGMIVGMQLRLDRPYDGRKYIWFSSTNYNKGASSGSPVHLAGEPGARITFVTEGPLKGDLAHAISGRTFGCVAGVNQYGNLPDFLSRMKEYGTETIYEAYDMDKLTGIMCRGDYNEKCSSCQFYKSNWKELEIVCEKKVVKRNNIQRGCKNLTRICRELSLPCKRLTWDLDGDGDWAENVKGVDDYLVDLEQKKKNEGERKEKTLER